MFIVGIGFGAYSAVDFALVMDVLPAEKDKAKDLAVWHQVNYQPRERLCSSVEDVQDCGGIPSVRWRDTICIVEVYHLYCGGIPPVLWRVATSILEKCHQHCGGIPSLF